MDRNYGQITVSVYLMHQSAALGLPGRGFFFLWDGKTPSGQPIAPSGGNRSPNHNRPTLHRAAGKIFGELGVPFAGLGGDGALGGGALFRGAPHIKTLVRNHPSTPPTVTSAVRTLRAKGKAMVNIHRGRSSPDGTEAQRRGDRARESAYR